MRLAAVLPFLLLTTPAYPCTFVVVGDLTVTHAWSRATIGAGRPGVLYLQIRNDGATDDSLTGVATPAAGMPMLHQTVVTDGIASMPHAMAMPVPAGQTARLEPGGYHGMLMDLSGPLREGETFPVTLTFAEAGPVTIDAEVGSLAASGPACE